jgi:hypothetical protein
MRYPNISKSREVKGARQVKPIITVMLCISFCLSVQANAQCAAKTSATGRWRDPLKPSDRLEDMCKRHISTYQAEQGKMVIVNMNPADCAAALEFVRSNGNESWHGDWFLWNKIGCEHGMFVFIK